MAAGFVVWVVLTPPVSATVDTCPEPPHGGDAMGEIDDALQDRLDAGAAEMIPVIVTMTGAIDEGALTACGLEIAHRFDAIGAVSGAIAASEVPRLAALPGVKSVELDSEMRAMDP
jgi:hypothetical protein